MTGKIQFLFCSLLYLSLSIVNDVVFVDFSWASSRLGAVFFIFFFPLYKKSGIVLARRIPPSTISRRQLRDSRVSLSVNGKVVANVAEHPDRPRNRDHLLRTSRRVQGVALHALLRIVSRFLNPAAVGKRRSPWEICRRRSREDKYLIHRAQHAGCLRAAGIDQMPRRI